MLRAELLELLRDGVRRRDHLADGWLDEELDRLTAAARRLAGEHGLDPIPRDVVDSYDRLSTGSDWAEKLALRVADHLVGNGWLAPPAA